MNIKEMYERIDVLSDEIDTNEEENSSMQTEIDLLYREIDTREELESGRAI